MSRAEHQWLDTAVCIASRIVSAALWRGDRCTWIVRVPDRIPGVLRAHAEPAAGTLYQGSAGIALFLTEVFRQTGEVRFLTTAEGALRHAWETACALPPWSFGFHSGRVGIAYAHYRFSLVTQRAEAMDAASAILEPLIGNARRDEGIDVIGGAAGAIPALLIMSQDLGTDRTQDLAIALGEWLLHRARQGCRGWSWRGLPSCVQDLTGFAHGASGCSTALLEVFQATGDQRFRYAAEQGFAYEEQWFDPSDGNWPDFRYIALSEYLSYGRTAELRARLRAGQNLPPYRPSFMVAWCHGAPGIAVARLRAFALLGNPAYAHMARVAAETTCRAVQSSGDNYSLCHGYLGNSETLIEAGRALGRPEFLAAVEARAEEGRGQYEFAGRPWPCGTLGSVTDPSLLVGEAGIGHFYLRLYDPTTPSVLWPGRTQTLARPVLATAGGAARLRCAYIDRHFGVTLRGLERLHPDSPSPLDDPSPEPGTADIPRVHATIRACICAERDEARRLKLEDAFAVERARFALNMKCHDHTTEVLHDLARTAPDEVPWEAVTIRLAPLVQLIRTERDWKLWASDPARVERNATLEGVTTVVYWLGGEARSTTLGVFAALVLSCAATPGTWSELTRRVAERAEGPEPTDWAGLVLQQLKTAYAARLIDCHRPGLLVEPARMVAALQADG